MSGAIIEILSPLFLIYGGPHPCLCSCLLLPGLVDVDTGIRGCMGDCPGDGCIVILSGSHMIGVRAGHTRWAAAAARRCSGQWP
jgi:hypothetical protein